MITKQFYLVNDKFGPDYDSSGHIILLIKDGQGVEYSLRYPTKDELIPPL
jgi:hypothetical protein